MESSTPPIPLLIGLTLHKGQEELLLTGDSSHSRAELRKEFSRLTANVSEEIRTGHTLDQALHLAEALHLGWALAKWPAFQEQFEILHVEKEERLRLSSGQVFMARADAVVRERSSGFIYVFNWKSTKKKKDWNTMWLRDVQAWTEAMVIEQALGEAVSGCIFEGFFKGVELGPIWSSPLIYGFRNGAGEVSSTWKRGWDRLAAWREFGLDSWFAKLSPATIHDQFLRSEPVLKNDEVVREWLEQVVMKEEAIDHVLTNGSEQEQLVFFSQNFSPWNCAGCPFDPVCQKRSSIEELLKDGFLVPRVDHHALPLDSARKACDPIDEREVIPNVQA